MAGLLTFPQSALPSQPCPRPVTFSKQTLCFEGITAAGTVPDSHRIPLHRSGPKPPDYHHLRPQRYNNFLNYQPNHPKNHNKKNY